MVQNDRKLYDSLFELRVRAFDRSLQHRGGEEEEEEGARGKSPPILSYGSAFISCLPLLGGD